MHNLPEGFLEALGLRSSTPPTPSRDVSQPFGFFAPQSKPLAEEETEIEPPCIHKLFFEPPISSGADFIGSGYDASPVRFLGDEENGEPDALTPFKKMLAAGIYADTLATAPKSPALAKRSTVEKPTPKKTESPDPNEKLTVKYRQSHGEVFREAFDAAGDVKSFRWLTEPEDIALAKRDPSFHVQDEPLEKASGEVDSISEALIAAFENIERADEETDLDFFDRVAEELRRLGVRPPLSTTY